MGYGDSQYGIDGYGIGDGSGGPVTVADLLVQATNRHIGSTVVVSGIGSTLVDTSRDDLFPGPLLDVIRWGQALSGSVDVSLATGVTATLHKRGVASSWLIQTVPTYTSADVSVSYEIQSTFNADTVVSTLTYAALEYFVSSNTKITISRVLNPGTFGHQIIVRHINGGAELGRATLASTTKRGTFRIIKHANILTVMHDDVVLLESKSATVGASGIIKIYANTGTDNAYISTKFTNYRSTTGVLFGDRPMLIKSVQRGDKIVGLIPYNSTSGAVDVLVFNHSGLIGSRTAGFIYPLVEGVALTSSDGVHATVQNDNVLRP